MKPRFGKSGWTEYQGMCRIVREPVDDGLVSRKSTADAVGREGLVLKSRTKGARSTLHLREACGFALTLEQVPRRPAGLFQ